MKIKNDIKIKTETKPFGTKKSQNLLGSKEITQPFGTKKSNNLQRQKKSHYNLEKKNYATS